MGQWVVDTIKEYGEYKDFFYDKEEKSLFHLTASMMKILNNFQEISLSKLHQHESEMLENALRIFAKQCLGQIDKASKEKEIEKKAELIEDIEDSVVKIFDVMRNVIEGTGGIDWQYIQKPSFSTSLYQVSPKYWSFYMKLIQEISSVFNTQEIEYAFVLQPTLKNCIETELLLEKKDTSGKVVVLYVPVYRAENVKYVSICLIHEIFHVLTKKERRRKERAAAFSSVAYLALKEIIFEGVVFDEQDMQRDYQLKELLFSRWMNEAILHIEELSKLPEDDKNFYSKILMREIGELFWEQLHKSKDSLSRDIFSMKGLDGYEVLNDYEAFEKKCKEAEETAKKIEFNISSVVCQKKWIHTLKMIMEMFQECYSDILTLALIGIKGSLYENAFLESAFFAYSKEEYNNANKQLRMMLVSGTLHNIGLDSDDWKTFSDKQKKLLNLESSDNVANIIGQSTIKKGNVNLGFTQEMEEIYLQYLVKCAHSFIDNYGEHPTVKRIQKCFEVLLAESDMNVLIDMLEQNVKYWGNEGETTCVQ